MPAAKNNDVAQITRDIGGLHASHPITPYLSLVARSQSFAREDLDHELYTMKTLGRIRCMRKSIYILTPELLTAAHWATRSLTVEASRRYLEFQGVSHRDYCKISEQVQQLLKNGELTAAEIMQALNLRQNMSALLGLMCDQGLLIRGRLDHGWADVNYRYALFTDYFPNVHLEPMGEREATMRLARHYLKSFGPVTEADLAGWIGLSRISVHIALQHMQGEVIHVQIAARAEDYLMLRCDAESLQQMQPLSQPIANLLPSHDPYLVAYQQRGRYLDVQNTDRVFDQIGNVTSTVVLNGWVVGVWDFQAEESALKLFLFEIVAGDALATIEAEARRIGRFISGAEVDVCWCADMTPLTRQPAGHVTSPLKDVWGRSVNRAATPAAI